MARVQTKKRETEKQMTQRLQETPPFALVEAFRNLASNIGFAIPKTREEGGRVICISSAIAGEGKTTVAVNMAISCATIGAKTVLVDCDLRKPAVRKYFDVNGSKGLLDYLSGQAELGEVIQREVSKNLDVIIGRRSAPNPFALLKNGLFEQMLKQLEREYDYVIIDTPPLGIVSDAITVAAHTDGLILVARQMVSTHPMIQQVIADIDFAGVNFLGFVLNDYNMKNAGKEYYKKYKYSYKNQY